MSATHQRFLTAAVIGMGVLILIGLIALAVGVARKAGGGDGAGATAAEPGRPVAETAAGPALPLRTDPVSLGLPAGAEVLRMTPVGRALAVLTRLPSGAQIIHVVPLDSRQAPLRIRVAGPAAESGGRR